MKFENFQFTGTYKKVLLRGPLLTQSGYGVHARQVAKWLFSREDLDIEVQALPWGDTPWLIDKTLDEGFIGKLMEKTVEVPPGKRYDITVQIQLPNEWDPNLGNINIGVTAAVETDTCNPDWINACNRMTAIIVPSQHSKNCLMSRGGVTVPVYVIPEAYTPAIDRIVPTKIDDVEFSTPFNFLVFGQLTGNNPENERKNIFYTIKWICEAFKNDKDVGIVVKTNSGRFTDIDRRIINQTFANLLREVRKSEFPKVYILHGDMSDDEVASLYRHPKIKALVSLTKGEGFGLPILEAAASGLPILATSWSGHMDFLSQGRFIDIDYKLNEIHPSRIDGRIFVKGQKWAYPIEEDFKKKILKFKTATSIPKEWARNLQTKILENYSISSVIKMYNKVAEVLF